jgi:nicotinate-nucleotide--dimethylbenzimidazole phosphoribosyltransferase
MTETTTTDHNKIEKSVLGDAVVQARGIGVADGKNAQTVQTEIDVFLKQTSGRSSSFLLLGGGWKHEVRAFFTVWTFLTRLPGPADHHPGYLMLGNAYFPMVGSCIGIFAATIYDAAMNGICLPCRVSILCAILAALWMTGCFHEDGLGDSADGIGGGWTRKQILEIMTDTRLGTYGCAILILYELCQIELYASIHQQSQSSSSVVDVAKSIIVSHTLSRCTAPYLIRTRNYVPEAGPKSPYYHFMMSARLLCTWKRVCVATVYGYMVAMYIFGSSFIATLLLIAVWITAEAAGMYGQSILGGVMGDYLGATICVTQLVILAVLSMVTKPDFPKNSSEGVIFITEQWKSSGKMSFQSSPMLRLGILILLTFLWCACMGRRFYDDNKQQKETDSSETTAEKFQTTRPSGTATTTNPARVRVEKFLKHDSHSFHKKYEAVREYLDLLAKPVGSLGSVEDWAARLAVQQQTTTTNLLFHNDTDIVALIFAADHGVAADVDSNGEHCSSFPQSVTRKVLQGLERGIAGASVLARQNQVMLRVVDVGVVGDPFMGPIVTSSNDKLLNGTKNFCKESAMEKSEVERCIAAGRQELQTFVKSTNAKVVVLGEVGIGNTTTSAALIAHLANVSVESVCGGGATTTRKADPVVIARKIDIVKKALALHSKTMISTMDAMEKIGGAEIAALVGAILEAAEINLLVLVDGLIVTAAALAAALISPRTSQLLLFSSKSEEPGQQAAISKIQEIATENNLVPPVEPALQMSLRMGEATGALLAVPLVRSAAAILQGMGTIADILDVVDSDSGSLQNGTNH